MRRSTASNPCNRAPFVSDSGRYLSLSGELQLAMGAAAALVDSCNEAKDAYIHGGFLTMDEASRIDEHYSGLPIFPTRHSVSADVDVTEQLSQDFCDLSVILAFLQHSQAQQQKQSLKEKLGYVKNNTTTLQHNIQDVMRSQNFNMTSNVDLFIIPDCIKNITKPKYRYRLDYLILKESHSFASAIHSHYAILRNKTLN